MRSLTMLFARGIWKPLELWTRKVVGHLKWGLMGHPSKNKGHRDEGKWNCGGPAQDISEWENFSKLSIGCSLDILTKNVAKNLS